VTAADAHAQSSTGQAPPWPPGQGWQTLPGHPPVLLTHFADHGDYHPQLIARILSLLDDPALARRYARVTSGTKIHHLDRWQCPQADLITGRALAFFKKALRTPTASVDLSWATVYRTGDYTAPHSHLRAQASIVCCVDPGDDPRPDTPDGKLCFVDPRYTACCNIEAHRMTRIVVPEMRAGSMVMFPGELVHCVNPYAGRRPRITLSWNLNRDPLPGSPLEEIADAT
jgi:hypothetical protein